MSTLQVQTTPTFCDVEIDLPESMTITSAEFEYLCRQNPNLKAELSREGNLTIMSPTGGSSGWRNLEVSSVVWNWARENQSGIAFDSSTVFALPNGARRGPDVAWMKRERWDALTQDEKDGFPPLCPDFVVELRSKTDRLDRLQDKLAEFIANGAMLGFLIDPFDRCVHVYRPGVEPLVILKRESVSADPELPGLTIALGRLWGDG